MNTGRRRGLDEIPDDEREMIREAYAQEKRVAKNTLESDAKRSERIKTEVARVYGVTLDAVTKILAQSR